MLSASNKDVYKRQVDTLLIASGLTIFFLVGYQLQSWLVMKIIMLVPVSYTHLDVYKRQLLISAMAGAFWMSALDIGTSTVKQYNIIVALIDLCTVPLAYYCLLYTSTNTEVLEQINVQDTGIKQNGYQTTGTSVVSKAEVPVFDTPCLLYTSIYYKKTKYILFIFHIWPYFLYSRRY